MVSNSFSSIIKLSLSLSSQAIKANDDKSTENNRGKCLRLSINVGRQKGFLLEGDSGCLRGKLLHKIGHSHGFAATKLGGAEAVVEDAGDELADLIAEALAIPLVEVFLVLVLVLESELEIVGLPPRGGYVSIALGARNDKVAFRLHTESKFKGTHSMRILDDAFGIDIDSMFHLRVEMYVDIVGAEKADDGQQGVGAQLEEGTTGLLRIELTERGIAPYLRLGSLHVDNLTDESALDEGDKMVEGWTEGRFVSFKENELPLLGHPIKFTGLIATQHKGCLAEHMTPLLEGITCLFVMAEVGRGDIDGIYVGQMVCVYENK